MTAVPISLRGLALALVVLGSTGGLGSVLAQSPSPTSTPTPGNDTQLCQELMQISDQFDAMLYSLGGVGGPLDPQRVDWNLVRSFLAPDFVWEDFSVFPSRGNYTDIQSFWEQLNANVDLYPYAGLPTRSWRSCDPVGRRLIAQWHETFTRQDAPNLRASSSSIYVAEFAPPSAASGDRLLISRQYWWTSGSLSSILIR